MPIGFHVSELGWRKVGVLTGKVLTTLSYAVAMAYDHDFKMWSFSVPKSLRQTVRTQAAVFDFCWKMSSNNNCWKTVQKQIYRKYRVACQLYFAKEQPHPLRIYRSQPYRNILIFQLLVMWSDAVNEDVSWKRLKMQLSTSFRLSA